MASDLLRRQAATEATLGKYRGRAFDWRMGVTCVHLARFHLRQMGHRPPALPRIRSALAAKREMKARGWKNVVDMLDSLLPRIAPAQMLLGDLAVGPADEHFGAIGVCCGPQKLMGWQEDEAGMSVLAVSMEQLQGAWRV